MMKTKQMILILVLLAASSRAEDCIGLGRCQALVGIAPVTVGIGVYDESMPPARRLDLEIALRQMLEPFLRDAGVPLAQSYKAGGSSLIFEILFSGHSYAIQTSF